MILRSITLRDFGLYRGINTIDLIPDKNRPVVLFGGRNGAGKTTLLEAVRLALYGKRALGVRVGRTEYQDHLFSKMHVNCEGARASKTSVTLEFDYAEGGRVQRYLVTRSWSGASDKVNEELLLAKDGAPIDEVPADEWQNFLQELIPPGVSQLFFFDGEKIAEIASDDPDDALAGAVKGLLGIELVGRLRTDIGLFLARRSRNTDDDAANRLKDAVHQLGLVEVELDKAADEAAESKTRARSLAAKADAIRRHFVSEGGDAARRRGDLEGSRKELSDQITQFETELRDLMGTELPLAMAPNLIQRFARKLEENGDAAAAREALALRDRLIGWRAADKPVREGRWTQEHWLDLERFLQSEAETSAEIRNNLSAISGDDRIEYQRAIRTAERDLVPRGKLLVERHGALSRRLEKIEAELERAGGAAAGPLLNELLEVEREVAVAEAEVRTREEELRALAHRRDTKERERKKALEAQNEMAASEERAALAGRVGKALMQYEDRLLQSKVEQLRSQFVSRFNHLSRKPGLIADVRIDPRSFETVLVDRSGTQILKSSLSAGERQIYAVAMLWALARTSGRALPMIIDTPLARLDTEHRSAIVERYFPEASHQVIILSTDTEIDDKLYGSLQTSVSRAYRLDYDADLSATTVINGYFADLGGEPNALQQA